MILDPEKPEEQFELGVRYDNGIDIVQDLELAAHWFRKAAEQGHAEAQFNLGCMYEDGQGVPVDYRESVRWFRKSAEQGVPRAQFELGRIYETGLSTTDALPFPLRFVAALFVRPAVQKNVEEAVIWYRKSAEQGYIQAQFQLAYIYFSGGTGVPDFPEAVKWYRSAALQGHPASQYALAACYHSGKGLPRSERNALAWWLVSSMGGNNDAAEMVEIMKGRVSKDEFEVCGIIAKSLQKTFTKHETGS
jgi:TPR repeat protein